MLLSPIKEEYSEINFIDKIEYKNIASKCNKKLKGMKMERQKGMRFISKQKLIEVVKDIEAIRSGNYIAIE